MPPLKNKLVYLRPTREDVLDIARFHLEKVGVNSTRKITGEIEETISRLADFQKRRLVKEVEYKSGGYWKCNECD